VLPWVLPAFYRHQLHGPPWYLVVSMTLTVTEIDEPPGWRILIFGRAVVRLRRFYDDGIGQKLLSPPVLTGGLLI